MTPALICLALGIGACAWMPLLPPWPWPLLLLAGAACCLRLPTWRSVGFLLLGLFLGAAHGASLLARQLPADCTDVRLEARGTVASLPRVSYLPDGTRRQRFEFVVEHMAACQGPRRLLLSYYGEQRMEPGQRFAFELVLRRPWGLVNPGSFNMQDWFAQTGIDALGRVRGEGARLMGLDWRSAHHRLRWRVAEAIRALDMEPRAQALVLALTVADRSGIDVTLWQQLQVLGLNHLFVISGLHIGMVAGLGLLLGRLGGRLLLPLGSRPLVLQLPWLLALLLALFYAALAGFSLSTQRALVMVAVFAIGRLVGRDTRPWQSLLLAAAILLVINPLAFLGSGAWLSFGAVGCLLWLAQWHVGRSTALNVLLTHINMSLLMVPMGSWWFGGFSLIAAVANLLMVPLVGSVLVPVVLLGLLAQLLDMAGLAAALWGFAGWMLSPALASLNEFLASYSQWLYVHLSVSLAQVCLALLALALWMMPAGRPRFALVGLYLAPLLLANQTRPEPDPFRLTVLDVGQGTAVVIQTPERALLYDTGGGDPAGANMAQSVVLPFLRASGIRALDDFIISHGDNDHAAGLDTVLQALPVVQGWHSDPGSGQGSATDFARCQAGLSWRYGPAISLRFLAPSLRLSDNDNDSSCVLQVEVAGHRFLLPGDISGDQERQLVRYWGAALESDWLLAAHHGSNTSSYASFLRNVAPTEVVYTRGYGNQFGHPDERVRRRVQQWGARETDAALEGAISYRLDADGRWHRQASRPQRRRYWLQ
ncbi:MAG: DNA internalization-related competence protein ComEC/Rec2 [Pseudomonadota bacterium]